MNSVFNVFVLGMIIYLLRNGQVECKSDLSGFEFQKPVDYNAACGEPFDGEFPWLVNVFKLMRKRFQTTRKFKCNGNIIDKQTVVLLATCVVAYDGKQQNPTDYSIDVGKTTFTGRTKKTKEYSGQDLIVHPYFNYEYLNDDIAILKLAEPIEFSSYVHPICLTNDISKFNTTQPGVVPVWTYLNETETKDILNTAYLPIIYNNNDCILRDPSFYRTLLNDRNFCAGKETETYNLCLGSTGVSLALIEETPTKFIWYLKGILSLGRSSTKGEPVCVPGLVFTDVFKYYDWIIENKTP